MIKFILKRLLAMIPVLLGVSLIVFFILDLAPGDPAKSILGEQARPEDIAKLHDELGLDDPFFIRYGRYMFGLLRGDLGMSYKTKGPVVVEIFSRLPNTFILTTVAIVLVILLGIPLGVIAAVRQNTLFDGLSMFFSLLGLSMPAFWLGLLLILLFSVKLRWLPISGAENGIRSLVLPSITLALANMAVVSRTTRSSMLETIRQDYIRTVRAKGLPERDVITEHALRNSLIPTTTVIGLQFGALLGGSVITETVFGWPGIGRYIVQSIQGRDIPAVMGCTMIFAIGFAIVNLLVDLIYGLIDPRIKAQYKGGRK